MLDGLLERGAELAAEGVERAGDGDRQLAHDVLQGGVVHRRLGEVALLHRALPSRRSRLLRAAAAADVVACERGTCSIGWSPPSKASLVRSRPFLVAAQPAITGGFIFLNLLS